MSHRPLITLTTDFGQGPFAGLVKGVIWQFCPQANLVDLCHAVPPQDVLAGSLVVAEALATFAAGTVHLAVVDPGVGAGRRGICVLAQGQLLVGPDNGLLSAAFGAAEGFRAWRLDAQRFFRQPVADTFHGRDIFGPVAAHLANGLDPAELGPEITDPVTLTQPTPKRQGEALVGQVITVDSFGNLGTNLGREEVLTHLDGGRALLRLKAPGGDLLIDGLRRAYGQARPGVVVALFDSSDRLELALVNGDLAAALGLDPQKARGLELVVERRR